MEFLFFVRFIDYNQPIYDTRNTVFLDEPKWRQLKSDISETVIAPWLAVFQL